MKNGSAKRCLRITALIWLCCAALGPFLSSCATKQALPGLEVHQPRNADERRIVQLILETGKKNVGIHGLAFKENTDDLRESPAVAISERLIGKGLNLRIFDAYLSLDKLTGSNLSFALRTIPHLSELLTEELGEVFSESDIVLNFHRIADHDWLELSGGAGSEKLIDFTNGLEGVKGIYW